MFKFSIPEKQFLKMGNALVFILFLTLITSCNSPQKMLDQGNYYDAVVLSVEKLKSNPNNQKARETLNNAYPHAIDDYLDKLENENALNTQFRNTNKVLIYRRLNELYQKVQESPAAKQLVKNPKKYFDEYNKLLPLAAEEQYQAGVSALSFSGREQAKSAYDYFLECNNYVPGYKDVNTLLDQAYQLALLKVYTEFLPIQSRTYDLSAETFYKEVQRTLNDIERNNLVKFIFPEQAKQMEGVQFDQSLVLRFEDFVVGETHTRERVEKVVSDTIKIGETKLSNSRTKDIMGVVEAELTTYRMEIVSRGIIHLQIEELEPISKVLMDQNFPGEYVWFNEWARYNGDKRALAPHQLELCSRVPVNPILPQQMFVEFTKPIYGQVNGRLRQFYNRY